MTEERVSTRNRKYLLYHFLVFCFRSPVIAIIFHLQLPWIKAFSLPVYLVRVSLARKSAYQAHKHEFNIISIERGWNSIYQSLAQNEVYFSTLVYGVHTCVNLYATNWQHTQGVISKQRISLCSCNCLIPCNLVKLVSMW